MWIDNDALLKAAQSRQNRPARERAARRLAAGASLEALAPDELNAALAGPVNTKPKKRAPVYLPDGRRLGRAALWK